MEKPTVREQLISGSLAYLADGGSRDLSVRALATASGRSTMCVYSKFGSRKSLLEAVYERAGEQLLAQLDAGDDPAAVLRDWAGENPALHGLLFDHDLAALGVDDAPRRDLMDAVLARFTAAAPGQDAAAGRAAWAETHGAIALARLTA